MQDQNNKESHAAAVAAAAGQEENDLLQQTDQERDNQDVIENLNSNQRGDFDESGKSEDVFPPPQQTLQLHRLSYVPPFPVSSSPLGTQTIQTPPSSPLTNHEIYELIQQKNLQQQQVAANATLSGSTGHIISPQGSFKQTKRQSLYTHQQHRNLERQASVIVGTPGFRERYGK